MFLFLLDKMANMSTVSVGYNVSVFPALILGHTPIAKSFHQLRLHALSIQNVSLCRSESRDTPATSMMEVFVTIVNDCLKVNNSRREVFLDIVSGSEDFRKVGSLFQSKCNKSKIISQSFVSHLCFVKKPTLTNKLVQFPGYS